MELVQVTGPQRDQHFAADAIACAHGLSSLWCLSSKTAAATAPGQLAGWSGAYVDFTPVGKINRRSEDDLVPRLDPAVHLDCRAEIAHHID